MEPGRELDALVAEKVMGFTWGTVAPDYHGQHGGRVLVPPGGLLQGYTYPPIGPIAPTFHVPNYSTDLQTAWQVVEKMVTSGWGAFGWDGFDRGRRWIVGFGDNQSSAATMPHGICLAALAAVGALPTSP